MMNKIGIVSYNIHYNYSNYGSILQTYALQKAINIYTKIEPVIIDYCPDAYVHSNPYKTIDYIEDKSSDLYNACVYLINDIRENEDKIRAFVKSHYNLTKKTYYTDSFSESVIDEELSGYVCGSDAIWSYEYFGKLDDVFFGNYKCMKESYTISYAASFGETFFTDELRIKMLNRMNNFKAIGVRESSEIDNIKRITSVKVQRVLDPTFLLPLEEYKKLMTKSERKKPYVLIYSRKFDPKLSDIAEKLAQKYNLEIVEISLDISHRNNHILKYSAGVEEFLDLVYQANFVVTNSLHGTIFSIIMNKDFYVFPREHGNRKIVELLELLQLEKRLLKGVLASENISRIDYSNVNTILEKEIINSINFLKDSLHPLEELR